MSKLLVTNDDGPVRILTLNRPDKLNAFNQALYGTLADGLVTADKNDNIHVVVLTGAGRAFSAGTDLVELADAAKRQHIAGPTHGFDGLMDILTAFSKPLICAVNGLAVGFGATILGHADLVLMASSARIRCPFTSLALTPEAGATFTFPLIAGRQAATWTLLSSAWLDATDALNARLIWRVTAPENLLSETMIAANQIAANPLQSLIESKRLLAAAYVHGVEAARHRENEAFDRLLGAPNNLKALRAFTDASSLDSKLPRPLPNVD